MNFVKSCGVLHLGMSDHSLSYLIWKGNFPKSGPRYIEYRNMKRFNVDDFKRDLSEQPWDSIRDCVDLNETVCKWENLFKQIVNKHMPIRRKSIKRAFLVNNNVV